MTKVSDNVFPRFLISEGGSTSTPSANRVTVYAKSDGLLYSKDDAGAETALGGGGSGATVSEASLSGAVTFADKNVWYDGPSLSLAAGTYVIMGRIGINPGTVGGSGYEYYSARILSDATVIDEAAWSMTLSGGEMSIPLFGTVVLATTKTVKLQAARGLNDTNDGTIEKEIQTNSSTTSTASHMLALKIA
jgi:hypothetical protein